MKPETHDETYDSDDVLRFNPKGRGTFRAVFRCLGRGKLTAIPIEPEDRETTLTQERKMTAHNKVDVTPGKDLHVGQTHDPYSVELCYCDGHNEVFVQYANKEDARVTAQALISLGLFKLMPCVSSIEVCEVCKTAFVSPAEARRIALEALDEAEKERSDVVEQEAKSEGTETLDILREAGAQVDESIMEAVADVTKDWSTGRALLGEYIDADRKCTEAAEIYIEARNDLLALSSRARQALVEGTGCACTAVVQGCLLQDRGEDWAGRLVLGAPEPHSIRKSIDVHPVVNPDTRGAVDAPEDATGVKEVRVASIKVLVDALVAEADEARLSGGLLDQALARIPKRVPLDVDGKDPAVGVSKDSTQTCGNHTVTGTDPDPVE